MVVKYLHPVAKRDATGLLADVYSQVEHDFGAVVEPFTLHSPSPKLLAGVWMVCRESQLAGLIPREVKEAVAATVSKINRCPYCVEAHTIMLDAAGEHVASRKIREKETREEVGDRLQQIMLWSSKTLSPNSELLVAPPFSKKEAPEIVGTAIFYHYINRMASIFLSESPLPSTSSWLRRMIRPIAVYRFARVNQSHLPPGEALTLLPPATLPEDLKWTRPNTAVEEAYARFSAIISKVEEMLPEEVKEVVQAKIRGWKGEVLGNSHSEIQRVIRDSKLSQPRSKIATELVLRTAFAPSQVGDEVVHSFLNYFPEKALLGITAWTSFTVARRIASWLTLP